MRLSQGQAESAYPCLPIVDPTKYPQRAWGGRAGTRIPQICRDEIKEGMVHATPGFSPGAVTDELSRQTLPTFFGILELLLRAGVTT